nr:MAG TPA: hypothetical protein [Bacteriophage sp.]
MLQCCPKNKNDDKMTMKPDGISRRACCCAYNGRVILWSAP